MSQASSVVGLVTAIGVSEHREISRKRVSFINTGGFLGSAVGLGIPYLLDISRPQVYNMSLLAGGLLGIAISASLTSDLDFVEREKQHSRLQLNPEIWFPDGEAEFPRRRSSEGDDRRYGVKLRMHLNYIQESQVLPGINPKQLSPQQRQLRRFSFLVLFLLLVPAQARQPLLPPGLAFLAPLASRRFRSRVHGDVL